jgi:hypothetical protein
MTASLDELRRTLQEHVADVDRTATSPVQRAHAVTRRAERDRRHRRAGALLATGVTSVAAVAAVLVQAPAQNPAPTPSPVAPGTARATPSPTVELTAPSRVVAGVSYPRTLEVGGATYWLGSSYAIDPGVRRAVLTTTPSEYDGPRVLSWSTTPSTRGLVTVRIDGKVFSRSTAGALESGLLPRPDRVHEVVVSAPRLRQGEQIGVSFYGPPGE